MKKLNIFEAALLTFISLTLVNCAPTASQLKQIIEKDPSIVFAAIEKDPEKFFEVANKAAQDAQKRAQGKQAEDEVKKRDEEFANPVKPEIDEARTIFGNKSAPITIIEYSDFECPYCSRGYKTVKEVMNEYKDKVRVIFKHLPLDFHPHAMPAAKYFEAVARQGQDKALKFHDMVFENQKEFTSKGEAYLKDAAKKVGADMKKIEKDLKDETLMTRINADMAEAQKFGFSGTPGFLINGVSLRGAYPAPEFKKVIDRHLSTMK